MRPGLAKAVASLHALDAALGVNHPLLTSVEGVAFAAHLNTNRWPRAASLEHVATGAGHRGVIKIRVNFFFHLCTDLSF